MALFIFYKIYDIIYIKKGEKIMTKLELLSLLANLSIDLEWAEANEWETPICLAGDLQQAIELVKKELKEVKE